MPDYHDLERRLRDTLPDARIEATPLPDAAPMRLGLINADYQTGPLAPDVMRAVISQPAYWAFCWGSGLALAQWLLENPAYVAGKQVIDLGAGSGVAGIAAALAGAARVIACDNDPNALAATAANAAANCVDLQLVDDLAKIETQADLLLLADVLYDRSNFALLARSKSLAAEVLVADSRVKDVEDPTFEAFGSRHALTLPNLGEFDEFSCVRFFRYRR